MGLSGSIAVPVIDPDTGVTAYDLHAAVSHLAQVIAIAGEQTVPCDPTDLTAVAEELRLVNVTAARLDKLKDTLKTRSVELFVATGDTEWLIAEPLTGEKMVAKIVNPETTVVDLDRLRVLAGQSAVDAVLSTPKVSTPRWEHAVETGVISVEVAAEVSTFEPKASYVTFVKAT